jgi:hypothetical protein
LILVINPNLARWFQGGFEVVFRLGFLPHEGYAVQMQIKRTVDTNTY